MIKALFESDVFILSDDENVSLRRESFETQFPFKLCGGKNRDIYAVPWTSVSPLVSLVFGFLVQKKQQICYVGVRLRQENGQSVGQSGHTFSHVASSNSDVFFVSWVSEDLQSPEEKLRILQKLRAANEAWLKQLAVVAGADSTGMNLSVACLRACVVLVPVPLCFHLHASVFTVCVSRFQSSIRRACFPRFHSLIPWPS